MSSLNNSKVPECAVCLAALQDGQPIFTLPCAHPFHLDCIATTFHHGNRLCPLCRSPLPESLATLYRPPRPRPEPLETAFDGDDDELLLFFNPSSPTSNSSSSPSPTVTIETFPEFSAVVSTASPTNFAVLVELQAPPSASNNRAPVDLVAVLDVSGSMLGYKLALLKRAMCFVIDTISPTDRLSIVAFSTDAHRVLDLCCMSEPGRISASLAIDSLTASGETNIRAGLETGVRVLDERQSKNPVAGLILLSDGNDTINRRGFSPDEYRRLLPSHIVPIHTFGFGSDHDPRAMHAISDASGGTFSFVDEEEDIQDAFAMCIGGLLSIVAQQVELMVSSASDGVRINSVASGAYSSKVLDRGREAVIEVSDLYAEEEKDFVVHVSIPVKAGPGRWAGESTRLLNVNCSYVDPVTQEAINVEGETVVVRRPDELSRVDRGVNLMVDRERNRILAAGSIREAQVEAERENLEGARAVLMNRRSAILGSPSGQAGDGVCAWLDAELGEIQNRMENMHVYEKSGRAYSLSGMSSHLRQRAAGGAIARGVSRFAGAASLGLATGDHFRASSVGYQTPSMRDMVSRSLMYAHQIRS